MDPTPLHPKVMTKLPDMAVYGPGVSGNVKRKTILQVQPLQGSSFTPTGQRIIQIQLPKNGFLNGLNSYLCFRHQSVNANAAGFQSLVENNALSTSGSNWIQRLRIKIGGKIVEDIDDYNVLHEILRSSVVTSQFRDSLSGQLEGYEPSWTPKMIEPSCPSGDTATKTIITDRSIDGVVVNRNRSGRTDQVATATALGERWANLDAVHTLQYWARQNKEYQVVLLSGLLRSAKYLPLRFMPPVEIEITLADFARTHVWAPTRNPASGATYYENFAGVPGTGVMAQLVTADGVNPSNIFMNIRGGGDLMQPVVANDNNTTGRHPANGITTATPLSEQTYTISQVTYVAEVLEFDDSFYQAFEASLSQGITIPYVTYTNHVYTHSGTTTDIQVAERVRSARSLLAVMRKSADLAHAPYPKFLFTRNGLNQFQVKIGTQYFPMHPIDTSETVDQYAGERLVELQKVISAMADVSHGMSLDAGQHKTRFILGMDLQREFDRLSGLDTTKGLPLFIRLVHDGSTGTQCQLNVFISYDMFVDLVPGEVVEILN